MRTTLTLEPDVAAAVNRRRKRSGLSLKSVINELLRKGLWQEETPPSRPRYKMRGAHLGACRIGSLDDVAESLAIAEGDNYR